MAKSKPPKKPSLKREPPVVKSPRGGGKVKDVSTKTIAWHIRKIDIDGPWGWQNIEPDRLWKNIHAKMSSFESMTWGEVMTGKKHHLVDVSRISPKAQKRLDEIGQVDTDQLFSFRLSGKERIYGIRVSDIFEILWWDPNHEVLRVSLKRT